MEITDRSGWASGYTAHFDGTILYEPRQDGSPAADKAGDQLQGHAAYAAYGDAVGHRNFLGEQMPDWQNLPENIRSAWDAAAKAGRTP
jgi:hypothetical protein